MSVLSEASKKILNSSRDQEKERLRIIEAEILGIEKSILHFKERVIDLKNSAKLAEQKREMIVNRITELTSEIGDEL